MMGMRIEDVAIADAYRNIIEICDYSPDMMTAEDSGIRSVRYVVSRILTQSERSLLCLYAATGSLRKTALILSISHMTAARRVRRIRAKIMNEMKKIDKDDI